AADRLGAAPAWLIVDQDDNDPFTFDLPVLDREGVLRAQAVALAAPPNTSIPNALRSAASPQPPKPDAQPALPTVAAGLEAIVESLQRSAAQPSAAAQLTAALQALLQPHLPQAPAFPATRIAETDLWSDWLRELGAEPRRAATLYNEAAAAHPEAGIPALAIPAEENAIELPLWRLEQGAPRRRVTRADLSIHHPAAFAPRALLLTAILRAHACDLFIHGVGGASDDRITERWLRSWRNTSLAPQVMVTADLRLPLPGADVTLSDVAAARWRAHHARHAPDMLGDGPAAAEKRRLLAEIEYARSANADPAPHFRALHELLETTRIRHADRLSAFDEAARRTHLEAAGALIARRRDWPFPFHEPAAISALRAEITRAFEAA
ncbi:MAG: hypothetical protein VYC34_06205, partial [Planctomycetota bacterium]|nr:hypothetical protein [Planctomycetota bacterium]